MFKLIKTEFIKIFKKKSFLVVSLIFILYCLFTNLIYLSINSGTLNDPALDIQELEIENNKLNLSNPDDLNQYVSNLTTIALTKYTEKYSHNTQKYLIEHYLKPVISNYYETKYITKETKNLANIEEEITKIENLIAKENWEYFTNENISHYQKELQKELSLPVKSRYETLLKIAEYRLQNNIPYDETHYLHNALNDIATDITEYYNLKYQENLTKEEQARYTYITKELQINKYIIEHKADIHNNSNLRAILKNFAQEFDLFILIYVIMLSGSIVSEEFNKGTIKFLLTKPYKRSTILTSKLLTVLLAIPLIVLFMLIIELIIGGLIFGFSSLSVPVVIYNAGHIITYNIFTYTGLSLLSNIPIYLILGTIAFAISTIMASTSAAITISFLVYLIGNVIANLAQVYKFKIFKYLVFLHWDFSYLVTKGTNPFGFKPLTSIIVVGIYLLFFLCLTYIYFQKKDVKNV